MVAKRHSIKTKAEYGNEVVDVQLRIASDYAVRIMLYLLVQNKVCSTQEIACGTGIDRTCIVQVAKNLRKAGLITSVRGAQGGYACAENSQELMLRDVVEPFEGLDAMCCRHEETRREPYSINSGRQTFSVNYQLFHRNLEKAFDVPLVDLLELQGPDKGTGFV